MFQQVSVEYAQLNHDQHTESINHGDHSQNNGTEADNSTSVDTGTQDGGDCDPASDC